MPLSPLSADVLNVRLPSTPPEDEIVWHDPPSSPFVDNVEQENTQPFTTPATVRRESPTKPQKSLEDTLQNTQSLSKSAQRFELSMLDDEALEQTPRPATKQLSPIKQQSAVKQAVTQNSPTKRSPVKRMISSEHTLRDNEGLTVAVRIMEETRHGTIVNNAENEGDFNIDDTCFSTFSEIPNTDMTAFARLGHRSPVKQSSDHNMTTPRTRNMVTPGTSRRSANGRSLSPTPRRFKSSAADNETTNLLLDFTQQFDAISAASLRQSSSKGSAFKSRTDPNILTYLSSQRSPAKGGADPSTPSGSNKLLDLLDFELPPAPTPRSVPTITVREMESMKSSYQSQISQLTASLSGKEATIESLTKAVADAERRVGEAQELIREERSAREHAESEKAVWEKKGLEVESVLRSIRNEIMDSEKEREELLRKLEASERRAEEAETRAADAEAKIIKAEGKLVDQSVMVSADGETTSSSPLYTAEQVQKQIDEKVETLCRELHLVYKKKHETKVAALKKSYEAKSEKKLAELQRKVNDLQKANEDLQAAKDSTFSGVLPGDLPTAAHVADLKRMEDQKTRLEAQNGEIEQQKAKIAGLAEEMRAIKDQNTELIEELQRERVEKGELVAAAEQMLALQQEFAASQPEAVEDFRKSVGINRPSGLRAPGESRIARMGAGKSRMMSNIERMGGGRSLD